MSSDEYRRIEALITSADSPVGIDAKKTHVMILMKLEAIEQRLARLEAAVGAPPGGSEPTLRS
jgi:hypothetical protein